MIVKQNLDEQVYEVLQNNILSGKYKAGLKIVPNDIANELGISRTPITHALKRLEQEGLITAIRGGKYCIPVFQVEDVEEIYEARLLIERQAIKSFIANMDGKKIKELRDKAKKYISSIEAGDLDSSVKADFAFHHLLVKSINNSRIEQFFLMLQKQLVIYRYIGTKNMERLPDSAVEHISIIDFLEARDEEKAVSALEEHIKYSKDLTIKRYNLT